MHRNVPRLILICGLPGSGKSTLAKSLAAETPALRLCGDEWMAQLAINLRDEAARDRIEKLFWSLAQELLRLGQNVILESGFWLRSDRDEKRLGARALGAAVQLFFLDLPFEQLWARLAARNKAELHGVVPVTRAQLERWASLFQPPGPAELDLFDLIDPSSTHPI
ncbi:MAG: AAA family ATPase [Candidatus Dormiibacterota bacterium]